MNIIKMWIVIIFGVMLFGWILPLLISSKDPLYFGVGIFGGLLLLLMFMFRGIYKKLYSNEEKK